MKCKVAHLIYNLKETELSYVKPNVKHHFIDIYKKRRTSLAGGVLSVQSEILAFQS